MISLKDLLVLKVFGPKLQNRQNKEMKCFLCLCMCYYQIHFRRFLIKLLSSDELTRYFLKILCIKKSKGKSICFKETANHRSI